MFYQSKIKSIKPNDRVLEIGPGSAPHPRSNAFLEYQFNSSEEALKQRAGVVEKLNLNGKPISYYEGTTFPFEDQEFDYVICSHVIEHVPDPELFMLEVFRVGGGHGYIEYPLITYEYLYNFDVHLHFMKYSQKNKTLYYLPKAESSFSEFSELHTLFRQTLTNGWDDLCSTNKELYFEGFEFNSVFSVSKTDSISALIPPTKNITKKKKVRKLIGKILNKLHL